MPLYRFNTYGWKSHIDEEGLHLPDATTACAHAVRCMGELLRDHANDNANDKHMWMIIYDGAGVALCELSFSAKRL